METLTIKDLKKICKIRHIKNYSKLSKKGLINIIDIYNNAIKIQRWFRNILSNGEKCPISFEKIKYPCFPYKTNTGVFIYYSIDNLKDYLINSGNFTDPITRKKYTDKELKTIDSIDKYYTKYFKQNKINKSVYKFSKRKKFYREKKDKENDLLALESQLDSITKELIDIIENEMDINEEIKQKVDYLLHNYQFIFRRIIFRRSKYQAEYSIDKTIERVNFIMDKGDFNNDYFLLRDYIIHNMYQLKEEIYFISFQNKNQ